MHDDCVVRSYIPPGFAYQLWLDKVKDYRNTKEKFRNTEASVRLLPRVPPNIHASVSSPIIVRSESAVTGGRSMVMLMGTPEGKIADLRK